MIIQQPGADNMTVLLNNDQQQCAYVYNGDCRDLMREWVHAGTKFNLIFADPPFNIGQEYDEHDDRMTASQFTVFTSEWITRCRQLLATGGVLVLNTPDNMVLQVLQGCSGMVRIDWIIWHYRFGQCVRSKFISSHTHILVFKADESLHTWNPDDILVESLRSSKYNDARIDDYENGGSRVPFDVWDDIPRVVGNSKERMSTHPNQLPERLLERIVRAYSNVGDWVFDPFGGTGTTAAVGCKLCRNAVTIEKSVAYYKDIVTRLEGV